MSPIEYKINNCRILGIYGYPAFIVKIVLWSGIFIVNTLLYLTMLYKFATSLGVASFDELVIGIYRESVPVFLILMCTGLVSLIIIICSIISLALWIKK